MSRFATMKSRLTERLIGRGAEEVVVTWDGIDADVNAVIAPIVLELEDANGQILRVEMTSFICPADEIVFNSQQIEPVAGMRITRTVGAETLLYQVESPGTPRKCFEYLADRNMVRLYAVRIPDPSS